jgi:hypothetical protein
MFEPINRKSPEDRRSVPFDPAVTPDILQGQVLSLDAATSKAVLADGDVPDPMWAFTKTGRLDTATAKSVTVLEAPFVAKVNVDGYVGTPAPGDYLAVGTAGNKGKLVVLALNADATVNAPIVARCIKGPDSAGVILFKAIR